MFIGKNTNNKTVNSEEKNSASSEYQAKPYSGTPVAYLSYK